MKFTENFNLNLPDLDDMADVEKLNENFQTIDTKMKSLETDPELAANVVDIKNKIGTEGDANTQPTLFGRLAELKKLLTEKLAEVLTKVTGIDGKIGTGGDEVGDETLFGAIKANYNDMPIFETLKLRKEVVTINIPSGSGTYTGTFNFSKGKKKIKAIIFKSSGFQATSGTYVFEVDGTEYRFSASGGTEEYDIVFVESMEDITSSRILSLSPNVQTPTYSRNQLRVVVKESFSVTMPIKHVDNSGKANMVIFYE